MPIQAIVWRVQRGFWIACLVLSVACRVHAAELRWEVPEACPDVHALEQEAERVLGGPLAQYPLLVKGLVTHADAQLHLSLHIALPNSGETRERELQATSCQELLEAAAVAIALAAADSGEATVVAQSSDAELPNRPPPLAAAPVPAPRSELALSAATTSNLGALPQLGLGMDFQVAWMFDWLRIGAGVSWFPVRSMQVDGSTSASFGMYFVEVLLCGQQQPGKTRLFVCASAAVGSVAAHLDGPQPVRTQSTAWRAPGTLIGVSYPILPPLELTASLAAWLPLTRPRFYVTPDASQTLHEPSAVVAQLLLGLVFSL